MIPSLLLIRISSCWSLFLPYKVNGSGDSCYCFLGSAYTTQEKGQFTSSVGCSLDGLVHSENYLALLQNIFYLFCVIQSILCLQLCSVLYFWFSAIEIGMPWKWPGRLRARFSRETMVFLGLTFLAVHWIWMERAWLSEGFKWPASEIHIPFMPSLIKHPT